MKKTTLCYIEHQGNYLMLFRNKKDTDPNEGKFIGVGGKFLPGETPEQCLLREVKEETGFQLIDYQFRGLIHFISDTWDDEDMYLFTSTRFAKDGVEPTASDYLIPQCDEGTFEWVPIENVKNLPLWEGDRCFLEKLAQGCMDIHMRLCYEGDDLVSADSF